MLRFVFGVFVLLGLSSGAEAQSDLCADPSAVCAGKLPPRCLQKFAAGAIAVGDQCEPAMAAYRGCLTEAAAKCSAAGKRNSDPSRVGEAKAAYEAVKDSGNARLLSIVAKNYPDTVWGQIAAEQAAALSGTLAGAAAAARPKPDARKPGDTFRDCDVCPEMVVLPGGSFTMGSPESEKGRQSDEGPQRRVSVGGFALGKYEVTRGAFAQFLRESGHRVGGSCYTYEDDAWKNRSGRSFRNPGFSQSDRHPAVCVSWEDAQAYVRWLNAKVSGSPYRLPSEAELEYAIRAKTSSAYNWGSDKNGGCGYANGHDRTSKRVNGFSWTPATCDDGYAQTSPVGSFRANGFGLHDTVGNVWEWAQDCWNGSYAGAPSDGSAWMSGDCSSAVLRGGSWGNKPGYLRSAVRVGIQRVNRYNNVGFRVARTFTR